MFHFNKEDHTLGNLLAARLVKAPHVLFAAYKVAHPLSAKFDLRVQTDGQVTPTDAVVQACRDIVQDLAELSRQFTKEWELRKIAKTGDAAAAASVARQQAGGPSGAGGGRGLVG